jgi:hypothetical protein
MLSDTGASGVAAQRRAIGGGAPGTPARAGTLLSPTTVSVHMPAKRLI